MWLTILASIAFIAPLGVVVMVEHTKNVAKLKDEAQNYQGTIAASEEARARYYQNVETKKGELKQLMDKAQTDYQTLLQDQPKQVTAHQKTTTQTVTEPVVVKKSVPSTTSSTSSSTSKPTSTRKTKTS